MLSEKFEIFYYDGVQSLDQRNVCQFIQKIPFHVRAIDPIWAKINLMFLGSLSENCFEILWHYGVQHIDKSNVSQFSKI